MFFMICKEFAKLMHRAPKFLTHISFQTYLELLHGLTHKKYTNWELNSWNYFHLAGKYQLRCLRSSITCTITIIYFSAVMEQTLYVMVVLVYEILQKFGYCVHDWRSESFVLLSFLS